MIEDPRAEKALHYAHALLRALTTLLPLEQLERNVTVRTPSGTTHVSVDAGLLKAAADLQYVHNHLNTRL